MGLLRMSLSGAVMILVITVIRAAAIHKLPKKLLLAFWEVALVRLLLPVSFSVIKVPLTMSGRSAITAEAEKTASVIREGAGRALGVHGSAVWALRLMWMAGAALFLGFFALRYLRCRREFRTSLPVQNDFVQNWLSELPLRRTIEVRSLTGISTPLTCGIIHPVILMPKNTDWGKEEQLKYALLHEYVHIRRFDAVRKLAAAMAVCVHWFNPAMWVLYILFNRDIELVCDECVVRRLGGDDRASYARALISMEETRRNIPPFYSCFAKNAIEERIESIMRFRKKSAGALALALALVTVVTGTAFAASGAQEITVSNPDGVVRAGDPSPLPEYTGRPEAGVINVKERPELSEKTVFDIEGTVADAADTSGLRGEIAPNTGYTFRALPIAAGQRLTVSVSGACPGAKLRIGYADEGDTVTYVEITEESGSYSFTVNETGTYKLYLFNSSEYNVSGVHLSYNISNS